MVFSHPSMEQMGFVVREIPSQSRGMQQQDEKLQARNGKIPETDFVSQIRSFIILTVFSDCHIFFFFFFLFPHTPSSPLSEAVFRSLCQRHATAAIVLLVGLAGDGLEGMLDS